MVSAVQEGRVDARTTGEVIQEFAHVRSRRRWREDAVELARRYAILLSPLLLPTAEYLDDGLSLYPRHPGLGAFDAILAAVAIARGADALVSADAGFAGVPGLRHVDLASRELQALIA
ncbi:hypothetical protein BH24ACT1_BH24ACT1_03610 [soil metagenome]